jgi:hypothetical protein
MSIAKQSRASQPDQSIDGAAFSMEVVDDICALEARYAGYFAPGYFEQYGAAGGYIDGLEVEPLFDHAVAAGTFDMRSPRSQKRDEVASIPATSVTWLPSETTTRSSAACGGHWTSKPKTWTTPSISPTPTPRSPPPARRNCHRHGARSAVGALQTTTRAGLVLACHGAPPLPSRTRGRHMSPSLLKE